MDNHIEQQNVLHRILPHAGLAISVLPSCTLPHAGRAMSVLSSGTAPSWSSLSGENPRGWRKCGHDSHTPRKQYCMDVPASQGTISMASAAANIGPSMRALHVVYANLGLSSVRKADIA
eukprot:scaffold84585_cov35-Tisochrysis_lutea.AAC.1